MTVKELVTTLSTTSNVLIILTRARLYYLESNSSWSLLGSWASILSRSWSRTSFESLDGSEVGLGLAKLDPATSSSSESDSRRRLFFFCVVVLTGESFLTDKSFLTDELFLLDELLRFNELFWFNELLLPDRLFLNGEACLDFSASPCRC